LVTGLTLAAFACTKTEGATPKPRGEASSPAVSAPVAQADWQKSPELEKALEGIGFDKNASENLSDAAVLSLGGAAFLVVVSDEGHDFGLTTLGPDAKGKKYDLATLPHGDLSVELPKPKSKVEIDLEAVATQGDRVFLAGSASLKRKKPKEGDHTSEELEKIVPASGAGASYANHVYELRARGGSADFPELELVAAHETRERLLALPLIATFKDVPSKDNGLDVEGFAAHGEFVWFGLRGPVLRGRALVVRMRADFSAPEAYTLDLGGLGVRSLTYVEGTSGGLYILAGPALTHEEHFELYRFGAPEKGPADVLTTDVTLVASIPSEDGKRPEGLFPLGSGLCVIADGVVGGAPRCLRLF
jgi:hypothetical protein